MGTLNDLTDLRDFEREKEGNLYVTVIVMGGILFCIIIVLIVSLAPLPERHVQCYEYNILTYEHDVTKTNMLPDRYIETDTGNVVMLDHRNCRFSILE